MRAMVIKAYGGPMSLEERPRPTPGPEQVLVRVIAASVNPVDWKMASGALRLFIPVKFPWVPGYDIAGEVAGVGAGVTAFSVGMRVHARIAESTAGGSAEYAVAGVDAVAEIPAGMDPGEAAGLPLAGMTALQGLRDRTMLPMTGARERVLIVGASGGVGHLAVQIARASGATVVGVCSGRNAALGASLGAHEVIDYTQPDPYGGQAPFDVVYDCVAGDPGPFLPLLTPKGRYASCVPAPATFLRALWNPFVGKSVLPVMLKSNAADLRVLDTLVEAGKLRVVVDSRFPLEALGEAWARSKSGRAAGKIVIEVA
ncbi:MAG: NAD(P)-dependent alcohol dehydrogenase [Pseudomonadota bacterium]|nr:NAD(P)-dependent alcohol dehydrogenase [Pseudomonadota bacterium]